MPIKEIKIKEISKEFDKKMKEDDPNAYHYEVIIQFIEKALKQRTEEVISEMLVEKIKNPLSKPFKVTSKENEDAEWNIHCGKVWGHNQCCILQREKADKIKTNLCNKTEE